MSIKGTYDNVLSKLSDVYDYGDGRARSRCPCHHPDGGADLWLSIGDQGKLIVRCYPRNSGSPACRTADVVAQMGLRFSDLFPDWRERAERYDRQKRGDEKVRNNPNEPYTIEAEYEYRDPDARDPDTNGPALSYVVVKKRFASGAKDFPCKRPNPAYDPLVAPSKTNDPWIWNLTGVKKVLYRLPELRAALAERKERYVFLPEGEKDVDTARRMGLTATCAPGGVLKFGTSFVGELTGCNVVIVVDEDDVKEDPNKPGAYLCPGVDHARDVAAKLLGKAASVRVLRVPTDLDGGDLSDWRRSLQCGDDEARKRLSALMVDPSRCVVIESLDEVKRIVPLGEAVWPIPAGGKPSLARRAPQPVADPKPSGPPPLAGGGQTKTVGEQSRAPAAPAPAQSPAGPWPDLAPLADTIAALARVSPGGPRGAAEWMGELWVAVATLPSALVGLSQGHGKAARQAGLNLAAQLMRGIAALDELK